MPTPKVRLTLLLLPLGFLVVITLAASLGRPETTYGQAADTSTPTPSAAGFPTGTPSPSGMSVLAGENRWMQVVDTDTPTATVTATRTSTATMTPTRTVTATGTPAKDKFERNDSPGQAKAISVEVTYGELTLYTDRNPPDHDWFTFLAKAGNRYEIETSITSVDLGLDTFMELYSDPNSPALAANDDKAIGDFGSKIGYTVSVDTTLYLHIFNLDPTDPAYKVYSLTITEVAPEAIIPGENDEFEPNYDLAHAALIASGDSLSANFVPWALGDLSAPDNDYYRVYVKAGLSVTCETSNLGPSTDTNMVLYDAAGNLLGGNDDKAFGDLSSRVSARQAGTGDVYVLVGQVHPVSPEETPNLTYDLICNLEAPRPPATVTPSPTEENGNGAEPRRSPTPIPPTEVPTATQVVFGIRPVATPARATPSVATIASFRVRVFYDGNANQLPDLDEGVVGVAVEIYDQVLGVLLARGFTDERGEVQLTASAFGAFELRIPYFRLRRTLTAADSEVSVQIRPGVLPLVIP